MKLKESSIFYFFVFFTLLSAVNICFPSDRKLMMATTTSTDNTGLLDYIAPIFMEKTGIELRWVAVGTGKALALGRNCDVDILMVHAPQAEMQFIQNGYGTLRRKIMYNDFVLIGPESDPAGIKGKTVLEALSTIGLKKVFFISRGDDSGTYKKEISLWKDTGIAVPDKERWYIQTGQGMINTINIAAEMGAYTISDRGTFIKYESGFKVTPPLVILAEGDRVLRNQYSVVKLNPDRCVDAKHDLADIFIDWISSAEAQLLISNFRLLGKQLFIPNTRDK